MTLIANNLKFSLSSRVVAGQFFDLSDLFLNFDRGPNDTFTRLDASFDDPFTFGPQTLALFVSSDLSAEAGETFELTVLHQHNDEPVKEYKIIIDVIDSSSDTLDHIAVVENQLGQIFDPSDVDFGLAGAITGYSITAGGDYVQLTSNNLIALKPSFDPDDDNTTQFTFTVTATDGVTTADHTVTVDVTLVVDTPPTLVLGLIDITDNDVDDLLILTQEMINYEDSDDGITDADVYYILSGAAPSWVDILRITDDDPEVSNPTTENVLSFSHQDVLETLFGDDSFYVISQFDLV